MQPQTILLAFIFFLYGIVIGSFVKCNAFTGYQKKKILQ